MSEPSVLALTVDRGTSNNLFQVATLVRAATALDLSVRVLFRAEALAKLQADRVDQDEWAPIYAQVLPELHGRLASAEFESMTQFLRDAKEHGDDVRFWASEEALAAAGIDQTALVDSVDGAVSEAEFEAIAANGTRLAF